MTELRGAAAPSAVWFLYSESGEALGRVYREEEGEALPYAGARLENGARWKSIEVIGFEELSSACILRRFRVIIRIIN